jgi:hypothetical protein
MAHSWHCPPVRRFALIRDRKRRGFHETAKLGSAGAVGRWRWQLLYQSYDLGATFKCRGGGSRGHAASAGTFGFRTPLHSVAEASLEIRDVAAGLVQVGQVSKLVLQAENDKLETCPTSVQFRVTVSSRFSSALAVMVQAASSAVSSLSLRGDSPTFNSFSAAALSARNFSNWDA